MLSDLLETCSQDRLVTKIRHSLTRVNSTLPMAPAHCKEGNNLMIEPKSCGMWEVWMQSQIQFSLVSEYPLGKFFTHAKCMLDLKNSTFGKAISEQNSTYAEILKVMHYFRSRENFYSFGGYKGSQRKHFP